MSMAASAAMSRVVISCCHFVLSFRDVNDDNGVTPARVYAYMRVYMRAYMRFFYIFH